MEPFEHVVATHGARVLRVCRALLAPAEADDAWSETFLAALRAYPGLRADSDVGAWLVTIAHRKAVDQLRRAARGPAPTDVVGEQAAPEPRPVLDDDLRTALDGLAPKQRTAVIAHHLAGLPYAEVGELLGSSEAAARRSAADGIARLRTTFRPTHDHDGTTR